MKDFVVTISFCETGSEDVQSTSIETSAENAHDAYRNVYLAHCKNYSATKYQYIIWKPKLKE